jgi:hypothetical protein
VTGATAAIGLGGAAYSLNHGTQTSKLTPWVTERFTYYVFESDTNSRYARIVRIMQEEVPTISYILHNSFDLTTYI